MKVIYLNFGYEMKFLDINVLCNVSVELVNKHKSNLKLLCLHSIRSGFHISP